MILNTLKCLFLTLFLSACFDKKAEPLPRGSGEPSQIRGNEAESRQQQQEQQRKLEEQQKQEQQRKLEQQRQQDNSTARGPAQGPQLESPLILDQKQRAQLQIALESGKFENFEILVNELLQSPAYQYSAIEAIEETLKSIKSGRYAPIAHKIVASIPTRQGALETYWFYETTPTPEKLALRRMKIGLEAAKGEYDKLPALPVQGPQPVSLWDLTDNYLAELNLALESASLESFQNLVKNLYRSTAYQSHVIEAIEDALEANEGPYAMVAHKIAQSFPSRQEVREEYWFRWFRDISAEDIVLQRMKTAFEAALPYYSELNKQKQYLPKVISTLSNNKIDRQRISMIIMEMVNNPKNSSEALCKLAQRHELMPVALARGSKQLIDMSSVNTFTHGRLASIIPDIAIIFISELPINPDYAECAPVETAAANTQAFLQKFQQSENEFLSKLTDREVGVFTDFKEFKKVAQGLPYGTSLQKLLSALAIGNNATALAEIFQTATNAQLSTSSLNDIGTAIQELRVNQNEMIEKMLTYIENGDIENAQRYRTLLCGEDTHCTVRMENALEKYRPANLQLNDVYQELRKRVTKNLSGLGAYMPTWAPGGSNSMEEIVRNLIKGESEEDEDEDEDE
ncbi:MAG: hypothetical protein JKY15_03455 [Deltaproteobacteria bacterium]|nr:hypothetical protein [Deltaproteobacteria bacterium]